VNADPALEAHPHVLLVEDDADLREALAEALVQTGHVVSTAGDGVDALVKLRAERPDVVVLDLMMPKLDGWQFRVEQRRDPVLAATPIVAISASSSATAAAVDADAFLPKPLSADALRAAIAAAIERKAKQLEPAKIAQADRLATLGTLAAGIAHEINNPLTYVLLQLGHVVRLLPELGDERTRARVERAAREALDGAERIRGIMTSIRTFARVDETTLKPIDARVPLDAALRLVANELRHRARLVKRYADPPVVLANEGRLGQVFLNLLTNAVHALPEGHSDQHELRVGVGSDAAGDAVVEIADTGEGIPAHAIDRIFEPYFTTKPVGQGTGLGLSISRDIVASLGGTIGVTSELGRGATFRIVLPAHRRGEVHA
jgi:signal transduction histidine kinase